MVVKSLKLKNKSYYFWDDTVYLEHFDAKLLKVDKKESSLGFNAYYLGYAVKNPEYDINSVNSLHINIRSVEGYVEKVKRSDDRYLVISSTDTNKKVFDLFDELWKALKNEINQLISYNQVVFGTDVSSMKNSAITGCHKIRFSSNIDLPYDTLLTFQALLIVIRCVIEKDGNFLLRFI